MISLAVLDMAGTTVRDDGIVEASFLDALDRVGLDRHAPRVETDLAFVRETMGQSKIVVFRALLGSEELALASRPAGSPRSREPRQPSSGCAATASVSA